MGTSGSVAGGILSFSEEIVIVGMEFVAAELSEDAVFVITESISLIVVGVVAVGCNVLSKFSVVCCFLCMLLPYMPNFLKAICSLKDMS